LPPITARIAGRSFEARILELAARPVLFDEKEKLTDKAQPGSLERYHVGEDHYTYL
jgi:hypothetical protein